MAALQLVAGLTKVAVWLWLLLHRNYVCHPLIGYLASQHLLNTVNKFKYQVLYNTMAILKYNYINPGINGYDIPQARNKVLT